MQPARRFIARRGSLSPPPPPPLPRQAIQRPLPSPSHTALLLPRSATASPLHPRPPNLHTRSFTTFPPRRNKNTTTTEDEDDSFDESIRAKLNYIIDPINTGRSTEKRLSIPLDGYFVAIDNIQLRDACRCPLCNDPSTQQKLIQTQDIPYNIKARRKNISPVDNSIEVVWSTNFGGNNHTSTYSVEELRNLTNLRYTQRGRYDDYSYVFWDKEVMEKDIHFIPYEEYMRSDETLLFALQLLTTYGLIFLKGTPSEPDTVERIAQRIGNIKDTFYGKTWDVKSVPNSKNIAYTPLNLSLHMDLLYYESPPGLQFLHCLKNTVTGGSSYFADSFRACEFIRINSPNSFKSLSTFPVTFHYNNDGHHYSYTRPTVVLDEFSHHTRPRISHVNYSPPFQAPFCWKNTSMELSLAQFRQFLHGFKMFGDLVDNPNYQFQLRMSEGEVSIFQNRRVLHARKEFDPNSGDRWLKGAYVDLDTYKSKLRVLSEKFRKKRDTLGTKQDFSYIQ